MKIIFTTKGNISKEDKSLLLKQDILIVECEDTHALKSVNDLSVLGPDEIMVTAIEVLNSYGKNTTVPTNFGAAVLEKALAKIKKTSPNAK